jgi:hypothetical protein
LQASASYCRQTLCIAGKRYLLQANAFLQAHKQIAGRPGVHVKIGNASSEFNIAFL